MSDAPWQGDACSLVDAFRAGERSPLEELDATLAANGWRERVVQDGVTKIGQHFAYVDTAGHEGTMLELIEATPKILAAFQHMKEAARTWDGSNPLRISR